MDLLHGICIILKKHITVRNDIDGTVFFLKHRLRLSGIPDRIKLQYGHTPAAADTIHRSVILRINARICTPDDQALREIRVRPGRLRCDIVLLMFHHHLRQRVSERPVRKSRKVLISIDPGPAGKHAQKGHSQKQAESSKGQSSPPILSAVHEATIHLSTCESIYPAELYLRRQGAPRLPATGKNGSCVTKNPAVELSEKDTQRHAGRK